MGRKNRCGSTAITSVTKALNSHSALGLLRRTSMACHRAKVACIEDAHHASIRLGGTTPKASACRVSTAGQATRRRASPATHSVNNKEGN